VSARRRCWCVRRSRVEGILPRLRIATRLRTTPRTHTGPPSRAVPLGRAPDSALAACCCCSLLIQRCCRVHLIPRGCCCLLARCLRVRLIPRCLLPRSLLLLCVQTLAQENERLTTELATTRSELSETFAEAIKLLDSCE
jgi:hypothetical protein